MRPAGIPGYLWVVLLAWLGVALVAYVGQLLDRWDTVSYPDTLWMYVAFGTIAVAPAVGRVARRAADANAWGVQALLVSGGLLAAEELAGPGCPRGGACDAIGARGALGLPLSIVLVAVLSLVAWMFARLAYRRGAQRRPSHGRVRYSIVAGAIALLLIVPGAVIAAALIGADKVLRDTPDLALAALQEVEEECYRLTRAPALAVRAAPDGTNPGWTTFAVRRASEQRPDVGKKRPPSDWADLDDVHPYEATVSYNSKGEAVDTISCRRIGPDSGNATKDDLTDGEVESNPLSPKTTGSSFLPRFFTQGIAGPSEEAKKKAADDAKAAKAKEAKKAKPDADDAKDTPQAGIGANAPDGPGVGSQN